MTKLFFTPGTDHSQALSAFFSRTCRVHFMGASVTAQKDGYADKLMAMLEEATGHQHCYQKVGIGGTGVLFALANVEYATREHADITFLEYSTGDLNLGLTPLDMLEDLLDALVSKLAAAGTQVFVLHNYRRDFKGDKGALVRDVYDKVAKRFGLGVIANHRMIEHVLESGPLDEDILLRDVVHTTPEGSELYARHVLQVLLRFSAAAATRGHLSEQPAGGMKFQNVSLHAPAAECFSCGNIQTGTYTYPLSGQTFHYVDASSDAAYAATISGYLLGVAFISGPRSTWVDIYVDDKRIKRFRCFDHYSYFERFMLLPVFIELNKGRVEIKCSETELDMTIARKEHPDFFAPRRMKLAGLIGDSLQVDADSYRLMADAAQ